MNGRSEAIKALKKWQANIMRIPGVVAIGRGEGSPAKIVIYVEKLTPKVEKMIPRTLEGIPVEIRESGKIRILPLLEEPLPMAIEPARTSRVRPLVGGISIGSIHVTAGTLGCMAVDTMGRVVGVSNNHVLLAADWGTQEGYPHGEIVQPGPYDGGRLPDDLVGYGWRGVRIYLNRPNTVDVAVFRPIVDVEPEVMGLEVRPGIRTPEVGMTVWKSGRTTGTTSSQITCIDATVNVEGWGTATFTDQIIVEPAFASGGDSGSLVVDENGLPVGLLFAGSDKITCLNKASNVESTLGITLLSARPGAPTTIGLGWLSLSALGLFLLALA